MYIFHIIEKNIKKARYIFHRFEKNVKKIKRGVPNYLFCEITQNLLSKYNKSHNNRFDKVKFAAPKVPRKFLGWSWHFGKK